MKGEVDVPDGIDALVQAMEVPLGGGPCDGVLGVPHLLKLPSRHDTVLATRQLSAPLTEWLSFVAHTTTKLNPARSLPLPAAVRPSLR
jgi:hypothetical protein